MEDEVDESEELVSEAEEAPDDEAEEASEDEAEEGDQWQLKLVAMMVNASAKSDRSIREEQDLANKLCCVYLDYDDPHSLLPELQHTAVGEGKVNEAAYRVLRLISETQLCIGYGTLMVSPIEREEYRAHLDGLVQLADAYGASLTVIELRWESAEDESDIKMALNDISHLILPLGDSRRPFKRYLPEPLDMNFDFTGFVERFNRMARSTTNCSHLTSVSAKFRHFTHGHPLQENQIGAGLSAETGNYCSVCAASIDGLPYYSCLGCGFFLHKQCAELPQHIESPIHLHPLRLVIASWEKDSRGLFKYLCYSEIHMDSVLKCLICDSTEKGPFYGCLYCDDLFVHEKCVHSLQHVIEHRLHPHPLTMVTLLVRHRFDSVFKCSCHACGGEINIISYSCDECMFDFHPKCVLSLPPYVRHNCHKDHPLLLSMPPKDETNEYYCEVCAEKRHPDYWIYHCERCEYEAHTHCVVEGIPRYTYEEWRYLLLNSKSPSARQDGDSPEDEEDEETEDEDDGADDPDDD